MQRHVCRMLYGMCQCTTWPNPIPYLHSWPTHLVWCSGCLVGRRPCFSLGILTCIRLVWRPVRESRLGSWKGIILVFSHEKTGTLVQWHHGHVPCCTCFGPTTWPSNAQAPRQSSGVNHWTILGMFFQPAWIADEFYHRMPCPSIHNM